MTKSVWEESQYDWWRNLWEKNRSITDDEIAKGSFYQLNAFNIFTLLNLYSIVNFFSVLRLYCVLSKTVHRISLWWYVYCLQTMSTFRWLYSAFQWIKAFGNFGRSNPWAPFSQNAWSLQNCMTLTGRPFSQNVWSLQNCMTFTGRPFSQNAWSLQKCVTLTRIPILAKCMVTPNCMTLTGRPFSQNAWSLQHYMKLAGRQFSQYA